MREQSAAKFLVGSTDLVVVFLKFAVQIIFVKNHQCVCSCVPSIFFILKFA